MKRIAFIIGSMGKGGAERVISLLANRYVERGWNVDILMLLSNENKHILKESIRLIPIGDTEKSRVARIPAWMLGIRKYVKQNKPDRIVSFVARINIITIISCTGLKAKIIVSERNDPVADGRSALVKMMTYRLYPKADKVVFQTKWAQSCFPEKVSKKGVIISNPICIGAEAVCQSKKKIVSVGRLSEQKNQIMLIEAFAQVREIYPEYKLFIYGEGNLRNNLENCIKKLRLEEAVFLPGIVNNVHEVISDADMFVLPSNFEGLSNALLEALMMGLPCISTDCAGSNEVIIDGENGLLVPIGDKDRLKDSILRLIMEPELSKKLRINAKLSTGKYKSENIFAIWEQAIEK